MVFFEQFVQILCVPREYSDLHQAKQQMLKNSFSPWDTKPSIYLAVENNQSAEA